MREIILQRRSIADKKGAIEAFRTENWDSVSSSHWVLSEKNDTEIHCGVFRLSIIAVEPRSFGLAVFTTPIPDTDT